MLAVKGKRWGDWSSLDWICSLAYPDSALSGNWINRASDRQCDASSTDSSSHLPADWRLIGVWATAITKGATASSDATSHLQRHYEVPPAASR